MSADVLREAAALMRERAEVAADVTLRRPWGSDGEQVTGGDGQWMLVATAHDIPATDESDSPVAAHIASWHPAAALAVAAWLDNEAALDETLKKHGARGHVADSDCMKVANAYLGRDA